jgi:hypothetical protein
MGAIALLLATSTGCPTKSGTGAPTAHVQGTVTVNGQPIPADAQASITFHPGPEAVTAQSAGSAILNGKYDIPNAPIGKVKVEFAIMQDTGKMVPSTDGGRPDREFKNLVPAKWQEPQPFEITGDKADLNFDLK